MSDIAKEFREKCPLSGVEDTILKLDTSGRD